VKYTLREISNPAAVAWQWQTETGTLYQVVWARDGWSLLLGVNVGDGWVTHRIDNPERFLTAPTIKAARIAAELFANGGSDDGGA
jgi:hypothetical protein